MKVYSRIFKSGKSSWCADLGMVAGKRKRTFYPTRSEANTVLRNAQDVGRCNVLTSDQTREFLSAQQRLAAANRTIGEAVNFLLSHSDVIKEAISVLELADRCAVSKLACGRRPETTRSLQKAARQLSAYLDVGKMADTVCRVDIEGFDDAIGKVRAISSPQEVRASRIQSNAESMRLWVTYPFWYRALGRMPR